MKRTEQKLTIAKLAWCDANTMIYGGGMNKRVPALAEKLGLSFDPDMGEAGGYDIPMDIFDMWDELVEKFADRFTAAIEAGYAAARSNA